MKQFSFDFLALFHQKEHKQPVPCAIGASDSGKMSLFSPVFQIVPLSRIARITKQKSFNKSMIDSSTEVIFLDEAYMNLFDIDDWKIICQGRFTSHDVKWRKTWIPLSNQYVHHLPAGDGLQLGTQRCNEQKA